MAKSITQTGPQTYRELQKLNQFQEFEPEVKGQNRFLDTHTGYQRERDLPDLEEKRPVGLITSEYGFGDSKYDTPIHSLDLLENIGDTRAHNLSGAQKILNGLGKGTVLAGTTFLSGTIGLASGVVSGVAGLTTGKGMSGFWNDEFSQALMGINKWSEEAMPNYYSQAELDTPFYKSMFGLGPGAANFWGDKFIKNLGFTVGAFYAGNVFAKPVGLLGNMVKGAKQGSNASTLVTSGVGSFMSAIGEARIEAINNVDEARQELEGQIDNTTNLRILELFSKETGFDLDIFGGRDSIQNIDEMLEELEKRAPKYNPPSEYGPEKEAYDKLFNLLMLQYNEKYLNLEIQLRDIREEREKSKIEMEDILMKKGSMDMLLNIPILTAGYMIQFGKLYGKPYLAARSGKDIVGKVGEYATKMSKEKGLGRAILNPLTESWEEGSLNYVDLLSTKYLIDNYAQFYHQSIDPEHEAEAISFILAMGQSLVENYSSIDAWEERTLGFLTGALGMPRFRGVRSSKGFQSPITLEGGIIGEYRSYTEQMNYELKLANEMNKFSPETLNNYQSIIRNFNIKNIKEIAEENGDEFNYRNAEHDEVLSSVMAFDTAGKLQDIIDLINESHDTSDLNLQSLFELTTKEVTNPDGSKTYEGPFSDEHGNPMYSTPEGKLLMIDLITKNKDDYLKTIEHYKNTKRDIDHDTNYALSDKQLEELVWLKSRLDNWSERAYENAKTLEDYLSSVRNNLVVQRTNLKNQNRDSNLDKIDALEKHLAKIANILETIGKADGKINQKAAADLHNAYVNLLSDFSENKHLGLEIYDGLTLLDEKRAVESVNEIKKISEYSKIYQDKFNEYVENPEGINDSIKKARDKAEKDIKKKQEQTTSELFKDKDTLSSFRETLYNIDDSAERVNVIEQLKKEGHLMAKDFSAISKYLESLNNTVKNMNLTSEERRAISDLINYHVLNAKSLNEVMDSESSRIEDTSIFEDEDGNYDEDLVLKAIQTLKSLIEQTNKDYKKDEMFNKPVEQDTSGKPDMSLLDDVDEYEKAMAEWQAHKYELVAPPTAEERKLAMDDNKSNVEVSSKEEIDLAVELANKGQFKVVDTFGEESEAKPGEVVVDDNQMPKSTKAINDTNKDVNRETQAHDNQVRTDAQQKPYIRPSITEHHLDGQREGDFRPFPVVEQEKTGRDYSVLWNFLNESGAFEYVNQGKLKVGDTIGFIVSEEYENQAIDKDKPGRKPAIFMVHGDLIVGRLSSTDSQLDSYSGLRDLIDTISKEFNEKGYTDGVFRSSLTTEVSQMMNGRIPLAETSRSLKEIPGVVGLDGKPNVSFGYIMNGNMVTTDNISQSEIERIQNQGDREGMSFMLIKNSKGKYQPVAIKFNSLSEMDINSPAFKATPFGLKLHAVIEAFTQISGDETSLEVLRLLGKILYTKDIGISFSKDIHGDRVVIRKKTKDSNNRYTGKTEYHNITITKFDPISGNTEYMSQDQIKADVANAILKMDIPVKFGKQIINSPQLLSELIESGLLEANVAKAEITGGWFTANYWSPLSNSFHLAKEVIYNKPTEAKNEKGTKAALKKYRIGKKSYTYEPSTDTVRNENGNIVNLGEANKELLKALHWADATFGDAVNGYNQINGKVLISDNFGIDRNTGKALTDVQLVRLKRQLEELRTPKKDIVTETEFETQEVDLDKALAPDSEQLDSNFNDVLDINSLLDEINQDDDGSRLRVVDNKRLKFNKNKEMKWLNRVLPKMTQENRVRFMDGLIHVANKGAIAWGMVDKGIMTLSDIAAKGTVFHEAFHIVFDNLLTEEQRQQLYNEAREKWGNHLTELQLEEMMAEEFRGYIQTREYANLGQRIMNFFKSLYLKIKNWRKAKPYLNSLYQQINEGKFADDLISESTSYSLSEINEISNVYNNSPLLQNIGSQNDYISYIKEKDGLGRILQHQTVIPFESFDPDLSTTMSKDMGRGLYLSDISNAHKWKLNQISGVVSPKNSRYSSLIFGLMNKLGFDESDSMILSLKDEFGTDIFTLMNYETSSERMMYNKYIKGDNLLEKLYNAYRMDESKLNTPISYNYIYTSKKNPLYVDDGYMYFSENENNEYYQNNIIIEGISQDIKQAIIFDNKNALKLGSDEDIQGFERYMQNKGPKLREIVDNPNKLTRAILGVNYQKHSNHKISAESRDMILSLLDNIGLEHPLYNILNSIKGDNFRVFIHNDNNASSEWHNFKSSKAAAGIYTIDSREIHLRRSSIEKGDVNWYAHVLGHELIHGYTIDKYYSDENFRNSIDSLYKEALGKTSNPELYGYLKPTEFITEIMTSQEFINDVKSLEKGSIFSRFIDAIMELFGIQKKDSIYNRTVEMLNDLIENRNREIQEGNSFESQTVSTQNALRELGWTLEKFNSISEREREQTLMCI